MDYIVSNNALSKDVVEAVAEYGVEALKELRCPAHLESSIIAIHFSTDTLRGFVIDLKSSSSTKNAQQERVWMT